MTFGGGWHTLPQVPQFLREVNGVSHPLEGTPSQSPNPGVQPLVVSYPHTPPAHMALTTFNGLHAPPHTPQLLMSLDKTLHVEPPSPQQVVPAGQQPRSEP